MPVAACLAGAHDSFASLRSALPSSAQKSLPNILLGCQEPSPHAAPVCACALPLRSFVVGTQALDGTAVSFLLKAHSYVRRG